jgi:hypothetical protein
MLLGCRRRPKGVTMIVAARLCACSMLLVTSVCWTVLRMLFRFVEVSCVSVSSLPFVERGLHDSAPLQTTCMQDLDLDLISKDHASARHESASRVRLTTAGCVRSTNEPRTFEAERFTLRYLALPAQVVGGSDADEAVAAFVTRTCPSAVAQESEPGRQLYSIPRQVCQLGRGVLRCALWCVLCGRYAARPARCTAAVLVLCMTVTIIAQA